MTVNFSSEVYEANEGAGFVRVCILKDIESDEDLLINIEAIELDPAEAIGTQLNNDCTGISLYTILD